LISDEQTSIDSKWLMLRQCDKIDQNLYNSGSTMQKATYYRKD